MDGQETTTQTQAGDDLQSRRRPPKMPQRMTELAVGELEVCRDARQGQGGLERRREADASIVPCRRRLYPAPDGNSSDVARLMMTANLQGANP